MKYLVTDRAKGTLFDAVPAATLLKAQEAGARMIFGHTGNLFSTKSRQEQNSALLWDGCVPLAISVEGHTILMEPIKE